MILLIDNYDSFVYNLARYLQELGCETQVVRNDRITVAEVSALNPAAIVLSPGPGTPQDAGVCIELVRELAGGDATGPTGLRPGRCPRGFIRDSVPMLGVCLGHQAIAAAFGSEVVRAPEPVHGRTSRIHHHGERLFAGLPNPLRATRYHSLIVAEATLPPDLTVTAQTADGLVMAVEHPSRPVFGVQFHPESVLTQFGHRLLTNFLRLSGVRYTGTESEEFIEPPREPSWLIDDFPANVPLHW